MRLFDFVGVNVDVCRPYVGSSAPQHTLCERVERFLPELFVFVAVPGVPAHNNLAERSIRPLVVARKISGGTRSPKGSQTKPRTGQSLWHLDGTAPQSLPAMPGCPHPQISLRSSLNRFLMQNHLTFS